MCELRSQFSATFWHFGIRTMDLPHYAIRVKLNRVAISTTISTSSVILIRFSYWDLGPERTESRDRCGNSCSTSAGLPLHSSFPGSYETLTPPSRTLNVSWHPFSYDPKQIYCGWNWTAHALGTGFHSLASKRKPWTPNHAELKFPP